MNITFSEGANPPAVDNYGIDFNHVALYDTIPAELPRSCGVSISASTTHTAAEAARVPLLGGWTEYDFTPPVTRISTNSYPPRTCTAPTAHFTMTDDVGGLSNDGDVDGTSANEGGTLVVQPGDPVDFDASGSTAGDTTITTYVWDKGGTEPDSSVTATYYFEAGDYTVNLTLTDANDMTATASGEVNVVGQDTTEAEGGGGGGDDDCWNVYLIETDDDTGQIIGSWFLYSYCCGDSGCQLT